MERKRSGVRPKFESESPDASFQDKLRAPDATHPPTQTRLPSPSTKTSCSGRGGSGRWPETILNSDAVLEGSRRSYFLAAQEAGARLGTRQQTMAVILLGGAVVDKAVDRFVGDKGLAVAAEAAGDLLGRPTLLEVTTHLGPQCGRGVEFTRSAALAALLGECLGAVLPSLGEYCCAGVRGIRWPLSSPSRPQWRVEIYRPHADGRSRFSPPR
jgi:hypothetical protein